MNRLTARINVLAISCFQKLGRTIKELKIVVMIQLQVLCSNTKSVTLS